MSEEMKREDYPDCPFPHCDSNVLHPRGVCQYCDLYPELQEMRERDGINFTGQHDPAKKTCPAEQARSFRDINRWGGNRAFGDPTKS